MSTWMHLRYDTIYYGTVGWSKLCENRGYFCLCNSTLVCSCFIVVWKSIPTKSLMEIFHSHRICYKNIFFIHKADSSFYNHSRLKMGKVIFLCHWQNKMNIFPIDMVMAVIINFQRKKRIMYLYTLQKICIQLDVWTFDLPSVWRQHITNVDQKLCHFKIQQTQFSYANS